jgi:hypothetical protein
VRAQLGTMRLHQVGERGLVAAPRQLKQFRVGHHVAASGRCVPRT